MKKETLINLTENAKLFFGTFTLFSFIFADHHRALFITIPLVLWIASAIICNKVK